MLFNFAVQAGEHRTYSSQLVLQRLVLFPDLPPQWLTLFATIWEGDESSMKLLADSGRCGRTA